MNRALSSHRAILDGEIVAFDEAGRPSFSRLQQRMHVASETAAKRRAKEVPVAFVAFDLLWLDGHSLFDVPYEERRARLKDARDRGAVLAHARPCRRQRARRARGDPAERSRGRRRQEARQPLRARPQVAVLAEDQERAARGRRHRRLGPRHGQAHRPHRRAADRRRGARRAALRREGRHGLHGGRARPPREGARAPRRLAVRRRRAAAAARRGVRAPDARRGGGVHRMDEGGSDAPPVLQGAARGGAAVGVPRRRDAAARRRAGARRRAHAEAHEPRQGALSGGRVHQARHHRVPRARRSRRCSRTSRAGR